MLITIKTYNTLKNIGKILRLIACAKKPKIGGIINIPKLQNAICKPIIDCETSLPNLCGVRYVKLGKVGPLPKPIKNKEIALLEKVDQEILKRK